MLDTIDYPVYVAPNAELPEYLNAFTGSFYGNTITRVSDASVFNTTSQRLRHNYAVDQVWNSDGSLIKLAGYPAAILDGNTYEFLYWSDIPGYGRWSNMQPNIIYGTVANQFVSHNVTTNSTTALYTFSEYSTVDFGYGEGNQDKNDKYVGLIAENTNGRFLVVFDIQENNIVGSRQIPEGDLDWFTVSTAGTFAVASWREDGNDTTQGLKKYSLDLTSETHLYDYSEHGDFGVDTNGNEVYVQYGNQTTWDDEYYLVMIRLDNAEVTPLFHWPQALHGTTGIWGGHISCRNVDRPGWAYVSEQCCPEHPVASKEIFAIKLDGSGIIERYAKHHNNIEPGNRHSTQAVPNRDGTKILFASNWNNSQLMSNTNPPAWVVEVNQETDGEPSVVASAGEDVTVCEGETVTLTASGGENYLWNTGETTASIQVQPSQTTTYSVTVSTGNISDTASVTVTVTPRQTLNAGNDVTINTGENVTLSVTIQGEILWSTGETTSSITVSPQVTTTYTVVATYNGCSSEDSVTVFVNQSIPFEVNAGDDVEICEGDTVLLTATEGDTYLWSTGETTQSIEVSPLVFTIYTVTVTQGSASGSDDVQVTVNPMPNAQVSSDAFIEQGDSIILYASGGTAYLWSNGSTNSSITVNPIETTTYSVTVFENSCFEEFEITVTVVEPYTVDAGEDMEICRGETVVLSVTSGTGYLWSTGETTQSIEVAPSNTTTYSITVFDGDASASDSVKVFVSSCNENPRLDLNDQSENNIGLKVFPNPTSDVINVKLSQINTVVSVKLFDITGKVLINDAITNSVGDIVKTYSLASYNTGVYILTVSSNGYTKAKRIILK
ncbi:MAG TPA: T9SS type A sorting domain-containing protein [Flavobacteriaceae bacterium]|nr:T9SS type A sorting domain-containing protein [Flavobacteriaceae bacterium]